METKRNVRSHYKVIGDKLVEKVGYDTEKEALTVARYLNTRSNVYHKMVAYKCSKCDKWHVGGNGHLLTEEDREKYRKKLIEI